MTIRPILNGHLTGHLTAKQKNNLIANGAFDEICNTMLIAQDTPLPHRLGEKETEKSDASRLLPVATMSLGVMGAMVGLTALFMRRNAKIFKDLDPKARAHDFSRNLAINDETQQAVVRMVVSPNEKTMLAGAGVLVMSVMAFMGKTFAEGFKDVWVKRKEADIEKWHQERLIDIETQSFSGKTQIIRNMLSVKSNELSAGMVSFAGAEVNEKEKESAKTSLAYVALGVATLAGVVGLGFIALRNLTKGKASLEDAVKIVEPPTIKPPEALGGSGVAKPSFYSHVDDYRAFFYNWLLNTDSKQFRQLFFGITGLTAIGYGGKLAGEAVRDVEVKKMNADTEVALQDRLVATELRNFKAKKDAAIEPLMEEFKRQKANGKSQEELKVMADSILMEIKNGPPFVFN